MNTSLVNAAEQYFSNINPIAARIYADFQDTRNAYDCVWETLSFEEQTQVLNECIIKPEVSLQYNLKTIGTPVKCKDSYGHKHIVEENVSYRDEHSAPFSFKTASQVDLRLFETEGTKKVYSTPKMDIPVIKQKEETPVTEAPVRYKTDTSLFSKFLGRRNSPDAEQEVLVSPEEQSNTGTLPKTGLDFLDNW